MEESELEDPELEDPEELDPEEPELEEPEPDELEPEELDPELPEGTSRKSRQTQPVLPLARTSYQPPLLSRTSTVVPAGSWRCTEELMLAPDRIFTPAVTRAESLEDEELELELDPEDDEEPEELEEPDELEEPEVDEPEPDELELPEELEPEELETLAAETSRNSSQTQPVSPLCSIWYQLPLRLSTSEVVPAGTTFWMLLPKFGAERIFTPAVTRTSPLEAREEDDDEEDPELLEDPLVELELELEEPELEDPLLEEPEEPEELELEELEPEELEPEELEPELEDPEELPEEWLLDEPEFEDEEELEPDELEPPPSRRLTSA